MTTLTHALTPYRDLALVTAIFLAMFAVASYALWCESRGRK